jgi:hypothetical protein
MTLAVSSQSVSPEDVRRVTGEVLGRSEFQGDPVDALVGGFFRWLLEELPRWALANPLAARVLALVLTLVVLLLVAHIAYTLFREFSMLRERVRSGGQGAGSHAALEEVGARDWPDALRMAREALEAGNLYRALWITHRCLLSVLDARGLVRFTRWKTNGDYLRECPEAAPASGILRRSTEAYERVVYAHGGIRPEDAEEILDRIEALTAGVSL